MIAYSEAKRVVRDMVNEKKITERRSSSDYVVDRIEEMISEIRTLKYMHSTYVNKKRNERGEMRADRLEEENQYLRAELRKIEKEKDKQDDELDTIRGFIKKCMNGDAGKAWYQDN